MGDLLSGVSAQSWYFVKHFWYVQLVYGLALQLFCSLIGNWNIRKKTKQNITTEQTPQSVEFCLVIKLPVLQSSHSPWYMVTLLCPTILSCPFPIATHAIYGWQASRLVSQMGTVEGYFSTCLSMAQSWMTEVCFKWWEISEWYSSCKSEILALKHKSRILGQWSSPVSGSSKSHASSPWDKQHRV